MKPQKQSLQKQCVMFLTPFLQRYEGIPDQHIAEKTGCHVKQTGQIYKAYKEQELEVFDRVGGGDEPPSSHRIVRTVQYTARPIQAN